MLTYLGLADPLTGLLQQRVAVLGQQLRASARRPALVGSVVDDGAARLVQSPHKILVRLKHLLDELLVLLVHGQQILHEIDVDVLALKVADGLKKEKRERKRCRDHISCKDM